MLDNWLFVLIEAAMLIVGKYLLNTGIHPYFYALITGVVSAIIIWRFKKLKLTKQSLIASLPAISFFTLANGLGFLALKLTTLTNYNFIIQSSILIMPVSGWLFLKEKIKPLIFPLATIDLAGIAFLIGLTGWHTHSGDWITLLAAGFLTLDFVWQKKAIHQVNENLVAFWRRLISSLILGVVWILTPTLGSADWQAGLILMPVALFYVAFSLIMVRCLKNQPVADFNLFITLSPVLTAIAAFFLLKETMNSSQFLGAGLIMFSILVYNWSSKKYDSCRHSRAKRVKIS